MELGFVYALHAIFFLLIDLFVFIRTFSKRKDSPSQFLFSRFALSVFILQFIGIVVVCSEHELINIPSQASFIAFLLLVILPPFSVCLLNLWLSKLFSFDISKWPTWAKVTTAMPLLVYFVMAVVSQKTHWIFFIDDQGTYQRGSMFFLQIAVPYIYVFGFLAILLHLKLKKRITTNIKKFTFVFLYIVPPIIGSYIQISSGCKGCFTELGISAGLLLVYIGMYMGDAEEHRRLKDLADFNDKLQLVNKQLRTTMMRGEMQAKTVAESIRGGFKTGKNDKIFTLTYVSEQFAKMFGYSVQELMEASGGCMAGIVNKEDFDREVTRGAAQLAQGKIYNINYRVRCKDGSWKHVEERGRLIRAEGTEDEFWSVVVDQDELVNVENALASMEKNRKRLAEYNEIISNAGLGVWFVTIKEGQPNQLYGNEKFYELIGINGDSMSHEDLHECFANRIIPEDAPVFAAAIQKMVDGQFAEALYRWKHPTKGILYNRCGGTATKLPDGTFRLSGYHGDATDIVASEQQQQALLKNALIAAEESNRAKTAFLNNMSHDIRTPMNAILGFATLMEKEIDHPEKMYGYLKKLKGSGEFLLSLINNVLEMARIESGKTELNELPTCLRNNTDTTMSIFEAALKERDLTISAEISIEHNYVYADMVKIREIIINLVSNAIKYSKVGGHIETSMTEIPCSREGYAAYEFIVKDDGIGMSKEFLPHVFDSFVRERNSTESKIVGTGLGLPIVKKLVELMGGNIKVESTEGEGTVFTFVLEHKLCSAEDYIREEEGEKTEPTILNGKRILLAEDNDLNAEIAITLLDEEGFAVERAIDGRACLAMLNQNDPGYYDVILMDIQMPNMDGYEATSQIRKLDDKRKDTPIVAMTANAFDEDRRKAISYGMNGHVAKPIDMDILLKTLSNILK